VGRVRDLRTCGRSLAEVQRKQQVEEGAPKVPCQTHHEGRSPQRGKRGQEFECRPEALPRQVVVSTLVRQPWPC
jgi:hypothetical protein